VYIRFNGGPGVGNLASVRFGKPLPQGGSSILPNGGFEAGRRYITIGLLVLTAIVWSCAGY